MQATFVSREGYQCILSYRRRRPQENTVHLLLSLYRLLPRKFLALVIKYVWIGMLGRETRATLYGRGDPRRRPGSRFRFFAGEKNMMIGSPNEKPGIIDERR